MWDQFKYKPPQRPWSRILESWFKYKPPPKHVSLLRFKYKPKHLTAELVLGDA